MVRVRDVLALKKGDVIRLENVQMNDPLGLKIGNSKKFLCRPGTVGSKMSVQIVKKLEDIRREEFEELATEVEEQT